MRENKIKIPNIALPNRAHSSAPIVIGEHLTLQIAYRDKRSLLVILMFYCDILYSLSIDTFYVGSTHTMPE